MARNVISLLFAFVFSIAAVEAQYTIHYEGLADSLRIGEADEAMLVFRSPTPLSDLVFDYSPLGNIENIGMVNDTMKISDLPPDMEWIDAPFARTSESLTLSTSEAQGTYEVRQKLKYIMWDYGVFLFKYPNITMAQGGTVQVQEMQVAPVFVLPPPPSVAPQDSLQTIHDIKPILRENKNWKDFLWLIIVIATLLSLFIILFFVSKRKHIVKATDVDSPPPPKPPAHILALSKLEKLRQERLWEKGAVKEYQSELTFTIRQYLEDRFGIQALESTTKEIEQDLEKIDFDSRHNSKLKRILQVADLVKFAKAEPTSDVHESFLNDAENLVLDTKIEETNADQ